MDDSLLGLLDNPAPIADDRGSGTFVDERYTALFEDLQCNIVTAHACKRAHYFFLKLGDGEDARLRAGVLFGMLARNGAERAQRLASDEVPALREVFGRWRKQHDLLQDLRVMSEYDVYLRRAGIAQSANEGLPTNVLLTRSGYDKLKVPPPAARAFVEGMIARGELLKDPPLADWSSRGEQAPARWGEVDALVSVAYNPSAGPAGEQQEQKIAALGQLLGQHAELLSEQRGQTLESTSQLNVTYPIEAFGFREGLSQPVFYETLRTSSRHGRVPRCRALGWTHRSLQP